MEGEGNVLAAIVGDKFIVWVNMAFRATTWDLHVHDTQFIYIPLAAIAYEVLV